MVKMRLWNKMLGKLPHTEEMIIFKNCFIYDAKV